MLIRIDKYLKLSRIIKRREISKQLCLNDRVKINSKIAKPGTTVNIGDEVIVRLGFKILTIKVTSLKYTKDILMYQLISETRVDD